MRNTIVFCSWSSKIVLEWPHQGCDSDLWADCAILVLLIFLSKVLLKNASKSSFFPRASERRVLLIVGVCETSSHLHIFSSSHIFPSSHLHILTSSHLYIFTSSHHHIFTFSLALLPPCSRAILLPPSFLFLSWRRGAMPTRRHEMQRFRTKWGSIAKNLCKIAICKASGATLSHDMKFDRQKLM